MEIKKEIQKIEAAWQNRKLLKHTSHQESIRWIIQQINNGKLRIAHYSPQEKHWQVEEALKKAILLYLAIQPFVSSHKTDFPYYDKITLKDDLQKLNVRVAAGAIIRYGVFLAPGSIVMPSVVNIGVYVGEKSMIDINASIGSCAQIEKNVHISAGVVIGGVLEPLQSKPVIIEDNVFIGANSVIVEGVHLQKNVVIGANTTITASTKIIDVTSTKEKLYIGYVPENAVVIPGNRMKKFAAGEFQVPCALIISKRDPENKKIAINDYLRNL